MNLRKHLRNQQDEPHTGALNDILFILLFFFLIMATLANPDVVKVSNPKANSDAKAKQSLVVTIDSFQHFFVGTNQTNLDSLSNTLMRSLAKLQLDSASAIVINADKKADAESIVAVMVAARDNKMKTVLAVGKKD